MAIYPNTFEGKYNLQPGARGEKFNVNMPGYRTNEDRINRTNMSLNVSPHETPAVKYALDNRLPGMFRFGYAYGNNNVAVPKGRVMAVDPYMNLVDYDTKKFNNVLTIANGGTAVKLVDGKWQNATSVNNKQVIDNNVQVEYAVGNTGVTIAENGSATLADGTVVRPANKPMGIMQRNEMTRYEDAFNGMQPSPVITDHQVELPYFSDEKSATENPWGSCYGSLRPGDFVKSDCNGRVIVSPLSRLDIEEVASKFATAAAVELERQQIIGQVVEVKKDLVPEGAAKYVQWALSDRMNYEPFNPTMWSQNNRGVEDIVDQTPFSMKAAFGQCGVNEDQTGIDPFNPPGYPVDHTMSQNDLHMLASSARKSDLRMPMEYMMEMGIPGLTDGYNAHKKSFGPEMLTFLYPAKTAAEYIPVSMKTSQQDILVKSLRDEDAGIYVCVTDKSLEEVKTDEANWTLLIEGSKAPVVSKNFGTVADAIDTIYVNELQGFLRLKPNAACHEIFTGRAAVVEDVRAEAIQGTTELKVYVKYKKRGLAGVPTMLDWDGCIGSVNILLQK